MGIIKEHVALGVSVFVCALTANAIPAKKGLLQVTQPDGTELSVRIVGDERFHYYLSEDNYVLVSVDGALHYALRGASDGEIVVSPMAARPKAMRSLKERELLGGIDRGAMEKAMLQRGAPRRLNGAFRAGPGLFEGASFPSTGSPKALVVLVEYNDVRFNISDPYDYFSRLLNEEGFADYGGTGSARDFFIANSRGMFAPDFDVYGPITLSQPMSYYGGNGFNGEDRNPEDMVIEACQQLDATVDFSEYDRDGDGMIDNVFVFYAGRGENAGGGANTVWPHSADIIDLDSTPYLFDGVRVNRYACTNEWNGVRPDGIGTFVHEFSHVLGLPDLYVTTSTGSGFTPGSWSTLDYGPYNNDGCTPPNYSAFERYALGWLEPTVIDKACDVELRDIAQNEACIIHTDKPNEYFLFENRQQTGWDKYIPGHGMLVWHIDYNERVWSRNTVNSTASHQYVDIEEADNNQSDYSRDGDTFPGMGGVTSFTDDTAPSMKTWAGKRLGLPLTDIAETADGLVTFKVAGGRPAPGRAEVLEATDVKPLSFVANWKAVDNADAYLLTVTTMQADVKAVAVGGYDAFNVGNVTMFEVDGLTAETTYRYVVTAVNKSGAGPVSDAMTVTTAVATFEYTAPVANQGVAGENGFTASWQPLAGADGYLLEVYTKRRGTPQQMTVDFTGGVAAMPEGWATDSRLTYALSSYVGASAPSLRLNDNEITSPVMADDIHLLSFWCRGNNAPAENRLVVSAANAAGTWTTVYDSGIDNAAGGKTIEVGDMPEGMRQVKISHVRPASGALAVDDIVMTWGGDFEQLPLAGYAPKNVGDVTRYFVPASADGKYFYRVTASKGALLSMPSQEIAVTMGVGSDLSVVEIAVGNAAITVDGRSLVITNCNDANVMVADASGKLVFSGVTATSDFNLPLPCAGVYLVSVDGNVNKIVVK